MEPPFNQFEDLYQTHSDAIFRFLYFKLGDRERAVELMQETFMRTWQHLRLGKPIEHDRAFLYRIAKNLFINEIRTDRTTEPMDEATVESSEENQSATPSAERQSEYQELFDRLDELPETERELLILRYIEDWSVKDIAVLTGDRPNTISMRLARSLEKLKSHYHSPPPTI